MIHSLSPLSRQANSSTPSFTPHGPAPSPLFVGRERELDLVFGHIRPSQRGNVAVSGALGSGKSSLLRMVADPEVGARHGLEPDGHLMLYVDVQAISPFAHAAFWRRVSRLLLRATHLDSVIDRDTVARLTAPLLDHRDLPLDLIDVEEFLDALAARDLALVLLLDEFEWALNAGAPEEAEACRHFLAQMASLARRTPRTLSLVVATERPLSEALSAVDSWRGSPFSTIFTSIVLKPLQRDEAEWLIARAISAGHPPREADKDLLWEVSEGQPAVLQAACQALSEARGQGAEDKVVRAAVQEAAARARASIMPTPRTAGRVAAEPTPKLPATGLWIDDATGDVVVDGRREDSLTALEYSLLRLLYESPGRLCSKKEIILAVWGEEAADDVDDARVEKLVSRLRRKIEASPGRPRYVRTVRGRGYRFVAD